MSQVLEDGIKLSDEEAAMLAAALSASLFMMMMNIEFAQQMLKNVQSYVPRFGNGKLNELQEHLGTCVERSGGRVKHVNARDIKRWNIEDIDTEFDPWA